MPNTPTSRDYPAPDPRDAQAVFDDYQRRVRAGETLDLEDVCAEHPELANALRALQSMALWADDSAATHTERPQESLAGAVEALRASEGRSDTESGHGDTDLRPGDTIGNYRVLDLLGEGGFAVVYKAEQTEPVRRFVALKAIKAGLDTRQILTRFDAERQALAVMSHRSIAKVYDAGETRRGRSFFVMEFVDGAPIHDHCDTRSLGTIARLDVFLDVCDAIQHAHQKGIIHRDLKPANVLVTVEGDRAVPKIIDFGIAKALGNQLTDATIETEAGQVIGTPAYMSPEQSSGQPHDVDTRTDIYALGVLLYELLTGSRPFDFSGRGGALRLVEIQRVIQEVDPPLPSTRVRQDTVHGAVRASTRNTTLTGLRRQLRGDLDWIVMKAIAKLPQDRYATASELAADVRRFLRNEPVIAGPPSVSYRVRKALRRHRRAFTAAAIIIVSVVLAASLTSLANDRRSQRKRLADAESHLDSARAGFLEIARLRDAIDGLTGEGGSLDEIRAELGSWRPVWQRDRELEIRARQLALERRFSEASASAFLAASSALDLAPVGSALFREASLALAELDRALETSGSSQNLAEYLFRERAIDQADLRGALSISSDPGGAEVFLFRYVHRDARLLPVPFRPDRVLDGESIDAARFLRVEKIWLPELIEIAGPIARGDRFLRVAGSRIRTRRDLAAALAGLSADERVELTVLRHGEEVRLQWVPFPASVYPDGALKRWPGDRGRRPEDRPPLHIGQLSDIRRQLGVTFEGYPLDFTEGARIGVTREDGSPITVELPSASFLVVCRKPGHADARYPVVGPQSQEIRVELRRLDEHPQGYVWIPSGSFRHGGTDAEFLQNLPYGKSHVPGFFLSKYEETLGEFLEFVRDRAVDSRGSCRLESVRAREVNGSELANILPGLGREPRVELFQFVDQGESVSGTWKIHPSFPGSAPLVGVSFVALLEYTHWRSQQDPGWSYRLPTDLEWERAARGADHRRFVWGDYMIWSFCRSREGVHPKLHTAVTLPGTRPFDESVFGIRDMAGGVVEFVDGSTRREGEEHRSVRGGGNYTVDEYRFRTDSRFGVPAHTVLTRSGTRLVATKK